ncbi:helix-turn-helix domain-containing protein [Agromyces sp. MMS24-JH15]|uniref:TetR/AcrR family transcriptional regulator n=1 Tax=Agromyces sp. MMS24-JH15 TaxID=3243765 RepID=UPI003749C9D4
MSEAVRVRLAPEERRASIIDAARELYRERPYASVSMEDLAAAAGVARGLLHHYFGSKRELFLAVLAESVRLPVRSLPDLDPLPRPERARLVIDWLLEGASTYGQGWVNTSGAETIGEGSDVQAIIDASDDRAARFVLAAIGADDEPRVRARVRALAPLLKALCREWLQRGTLGREDVLDVAVPALLAAVRVADARETDAPSPTEAGS